MTMVGDTDTDGSLRIEGTIRGSVRAGKSVVVGKDGLVDGSVFTQDAVIAGRVSGGIHAESRLELQATSEVAGEIVAPRMQVEEGAKVQGQVAVGESAVKAASKTVKPQKTAGGKVEQQTDPKQLDGKGGAELAKDAVPGNAGRKASETETEGSQDARRMAEGQKTESAERQQQRPSG
jgi:cytoskeletal protein CcmA (bactofilin family)